MLISIIFCMFHIEGIQACNFHRCVMQMYNDVYWHDALKRIDGHWWTHRTYGQFFFNIVGAKAVFACIICMKNFVFENSSLKILLHRSPTQDSFSKKRKRKCCSSPDVRCSCWKKTQKIDELKLTCKDRVCDEHSYAFWLFKYSQKIQNMG